MATFLQLAERCEEATGPDRDLDYYIAKLITGKAEVVPMPYTKSLDYAMTLVPEGWRVRDMFEAPGECILPWYALLSERIGAGRVHGDGSTPALAMCAAALRALASVDGRRMAETRSGSGRSPTSAVPSETSADAHTPPPSSNEGKLS